MRRGHGLVQHGDGRTALRRAIPGLSILLALGFASAAAAQAPSRIPPDVVLDYSYDAVHLLNGAGAPLYPADERYGRFVRRLREFPPDILIVGKEAPLTHSIGPTVSFGGENRSFPRVPGGVSGEDQRRLLTPVESRMRIQAIKRFVKDARGAGVATLLPYVSPMTMFGDPVHRRGFFEFYDRWSEYASVFDLGPRPPGDPLEWTQRDRQGHLYFAMSPDSPSYAPLRRYSMCVNTPGWGQWQRVVTRSLVRAGYDGLWLDNAILHRCYGVHDQRFARELGVDLDQVERGLASRAPHRAWLETYLRYFRGLRAEGARVLAVNYIEVPFQGTVADDVDLVMIEHCWLGLPRLLWPCGAWTGWYPRDLRTAVSRHGHELGEGVVVDNLWLIQLAYAMRGKRGTHFLYGGPVERRTAGLAHNRHSALLALAEGAAFGGGVAVHVVGSGGSPYQDDMDLGGHEGRADFFAFARTHRHLFEDLRPAGDVALVVFPDGPIEALLEAQQVHGALLATGALVDVVNGDSLAASMARGYRMVVVPGRGPLPPAVLGLPVLSSRDPLGELDLRAATALYKVKVTPWLRTTGLGRLAAAAATNWRAAGGGNDTLLRAAAWASDRRVVLHLLNYHVAVGLDQPRPVHEVRDVAVRLRWRSPAPPQRVLLHRPAADPPTALEFRINGEYLEVNVPRLSVYGVVEVLL